MVQNVSSSGGRSFVGGAYGEGAFCTVCLLQHYKRYLVVSVFIGQIHVNNFVPRSLHYLLGFAGHVMVLNVSSSGGRSFVGGAYGAGAFCTVCFLQHYKR